MDAFKTWTSQILGVKEGGLSNRPLSADPGGLTQKGITFSGYVNNKWYLLAGKTSSKADFLSLTHTDVENIALNAFWNPNKIGIITNPQVAVLAADSLFNGGGFPSIGAKNASDVNSQLAKGVTMKDFVARRLAYYKSLKNWDANKNGWTNRLNSISGLKANNTVMIALLITVGVTFAYSIMKQN